jgi:endo-1,4-beta-D-glucanase Y
MTLKSIGLRTLMTVAWLAAADVLGAGPSWLPLYQSYTSRFLDQQIRVIDRDAGDRTTSEAQAYAMFFALVANDRSRFDALLQWAELNLASGDLASHLPAWLWGRDRDNRWGVLDANPASDADLWMAYSLLEAGQAWSTPRYTQIGTSLATRIARQEVLDVPDVGLVLMPGAAGFRHGERYRLNVSYMPLQLLIRLGRLLPDGPWRAMAARVPTLVKAAAPRGFASDWIEYSTDHGFTTSDVGSYDAIRIYLWAGLLDAATPGRDAILSALPGIITCLRSSNVPPEKIGMDGSVVNQNGPVGFSAALIPLLSAVGEPKLEAAQLARVRSALDSKTGLYGRPARYYDQNLVLFALGWSERRFWFDSDGALRTWWHR